MSTSPLPKRLKAAREAAGLSQKNLGIAAGMDEFSASARMNQYETGKHTPDYLSLKRIAKVLKLSPAYFYADNPRLADIIRLASQTNKSQQQVIIDAIHKILRK